MSAPFWKADPSVWPLVAEGMAKPWPVEVAREDLRWWVDQLDVGRARALPGRPALAARWGWKDCAVRKLLAEVDPLGQRSPRQPDASAAPAGRQRHASRTPVPERVDAEDQQESASRTPAPRQPDASATPAGRHTRVEDRTTEQQNNRATDVMTPLPPGGGLTDPPLVEPADDPDDAALPAWSAKAHRPRGVSRAGLVRAVTEVLEVIQGRPGASATAARPVLSLWKALEYPPLRGLVGDLRLIAEAAHDCPDRLFARDIRAEGWADGVNREHDPTTICRHDRWDARLQAARAWEAAGKPTARGSPASARASPSGGSWMDDLRALREPDKPPRKRIDPDHPEEPPWPT